MTLDTKRIPLFAGVAALVLIVAWYLLLLSPQSKTIKSDHKARAAAEQQAGQLRSQVVQLQAWEKQIPADNARFAQLKSSLPDNPQIDQALTLLNQAAIGSGVTVSTVAPTAPTKASGSGSSASQTAGPPSITLSFSVQGNMAQVKSFLSALASLPRTVVVDTVSLSGTTSSTASISARIFYAGQPTP